MIKGLYRWALDRVSRPDGPKWLAALSFAESSFFPIPPDTLLLPMCLARPDRAWMLALITTVASVLGAGFGYILGAFFFDAVAAPVIETYGYSEKFAVFAEEYKAMGPWIVIAFGVTVLPFKVVTIASGLVGMNPAMFLVLCIPARAPRFFLVAGLLRYFGDPIRDFIEARLGLLMTLFVILLLGGFVVVKWVL